MNHVFTAPRLPSWNSVWPNCYQRKASNSWKLCKEHLLLVLVASRSRNMPVQMACLNMWLYLALVALGLHCGEGLPLTVASGGDSLVVMCGLLVVASSLGARASVLAACGPKSCFPQVPGHTLSTCGSTVCGILPDQESNLCLLRWQAHSLPLSHQGSPRLTFYGQHLFLAQTGSLKLWISSDNIKKAYNPIKI